MSPRRNWDSPNLSTASECALSPPPHPPPPDQRVGGTHKPAAKGVGKSQFGRLEKKLSTLPTLWLAPNPVYSRLLESFSSNSDVCMCLAYVTTDSAVHSLICSVQCMQCILS